MNTQIYSTGDWKSDFLSTGFVGAPTEEEVELSVRQELTKGRVTFVEQAAELPIEKTNRAAIRTESVLPRFNKEKTMVIVGGGLYDRNLEEKLIGMKVGEEAMVTVKGEAVHVTVLKVERKSYPELSDSLVDEYVKVHADNPSLAGITDLAGFCSYMEDKLRAEYASALLQNLFDLLLSKCNFGPIDEHDIERIIDLEYEPLRSRFSLDSLSGEQWRKDFGNTELKAFYEQIYPDVAMLFGTSGKASFYESRREAAVRKIRSCLLLQAMTGEKEDPAEDKEAEKKLLKTMENKIIRMIYQ